MTRRIVIEWVGLLLMYKVLIIGSYMAGFYTFMALGLMTFVFMLWLIRLEIRRFRRNNEDGE